jgi:uncharacterized membrane protein (UPF0136 family)
MSQFAAIVLWVYVVLLFVGGMIGFLKAGSKASLITSASFAGILVLCASGKVFQPNVAGFLITVILVFLLVFFSWRLTKTKNFMPAGLMAVLTLVALILRQLH